MTGHVSGSDDNRPALTRRAMLQRSAVVGGALVWAAPVVQSVGGRAFAAVGSPGLISYVDVLIAGGSANDEFYAVTFNGNGHSYKMDCQATVSRDDAHCAAFWAEIVAGQSIEPGCPPAGKVTGQNVNGNLVVTLANGYSLVAWMVHDGGCSSLGHDAPHCFAPGHQAFSSEQKHGKDSQTCSYTYPSPGSTSVPGVSTSMLFVKPCADATGIVCH